MSSLNLRSRMTQWSGRLQSGEWAICSVAVTESVKLVFVHRTTKNTAFFTTGRSVQLNIIVLPCLGNSYITNQSLADDICLIE